MSAFFGIGALLGTLYFTVLAIECLVGDGLCDEHEAGYAVLFGLALFVAWPIVAFGLVGFAIWEFLREEMRW